MSPSPSSNLMLRLAQGLLLCTLLLGARTRASSLSVEKALALTPPLPTAPSLQPVSGPVPPVSGPALPQAPGVAIVVDSMTPSGIVPGTSGTVVVRAHLRGSDAVQDVSWDCSASAGASVSSEEARPYRVTARVPYTADDTYVRGSLEADIVLTSTSLVPAPDGGSMTMTAEVHLEEGFRVGPAGVRSIAPCLSYVNREDVRIGKLLVVLTHPYTGAVDLQTTSSDPAVAVVWPELDGFTFESGLAWARVLKPHGYVPFPTPATERQTTRITATLGTSRAQVSTIVTNAPPVMDAGDVTHYIPGASCASGHGKAVDPEQGPMDICGRVVPLFRVQRASCWDHFILGDDAAFIFELNPQLQVSAIDDDGRFEWSLSTRAGESTAGQLARPHALTCGLLFSAEDRSRRRGFALVQVLEDGQSPFPMPTIEGLVR